MVLITYTGLDKQNFSALDCKYFLTHQLSHRDGSFEYPQHMFLLRNMKNNFSLRTLTKVLNISVKPILYIHGQLFAEARLIVVAL